MDSAIAFADVRQDFVMCDAEARELYDMLQKAEWDRISEIDYAECKAKAMVARNALAEGLPLELIHRITGLDMEAIAGLDTSE